jgi:hypothetical protein
VSQLHRSCERHLFHGDCYTLTFALPMKVKVNSVNEMLLIRVMDTCARLARVCFSVTLQCLWEFHAC